jgi:type III secretion protein F
MENNSIRSGWGDGPEEGVPIGDWTGWMSEHSKVFNAGVNSLKDALQEAFELLVENPGDPSLLGEYQSKLSEYNMYRMLQSNSTKSLSDQSKAVIRNLA